MATMSDLAHKAVLRGNDGPLGFKSSSIKGVNKDEQKAILDHLVATELADYSISENLIYLKDSFWKFYDEVHEESHRLLKPPKNQKNSQPHYDEINGALYIQGQKIQIRKHDEDTKQNQLLRYIFITNAKDIGREFDFTEFPFDDVGDKKKFKEICRTACTAINRKIAEKTSNEISDFLEFNTRTYGWLKINPKYLQNKPSGMG